MTDSRVTPQAAEAACEAKFGPHFWRSCSEAMRTVECEEMADILAAAVPLLCQPLQDEIDRLRAALEHSNRILDEYLRLGPIDVLAAALAAIPVGTE